MNFKQIIMDWVKILKCTFTGKDLRVVNESELGELNRLIHENKIWQVDGKQFDHPLKEALCTVDGSHIYPIINGVVILLADLSLVKNQEDIQGELLSDDKRLVKNFYDDRGWRNQEGDAYEDAKIFEDLRPMAKEYVANCHNRVARYLPGSGTYILDGGSGALQFEDYLQYSENFNYRVCVDLSMLGLMECKRKLGGKGICLLADLTNLPVKEGQIDAFVSLNAVYHIPKDEQIKAINEMYRVLKPNGQGVVVYDWYKHSPWMNVSLLPFRAIEFFKHKILGLFARLAGKKSAPKMLYFYTHPYPYFKENLTMGFKLGVWRSISVPFMRVYLHPFLFGKAILRAIYNYEERNPEVAGLKGEYPLFIFNKSK